MKSESEQEMKRLSSKLNCWEYKKCGRQPGGHNVQKLGVCPVTTTRELDAVHNGRNAGRTCWVVAGSLCCGRIQGTYAKKLINCWKCDFMNHVKNAEEASPRGFSHTRLGMEKLLVRRRMEMSGTNCQNQATELFREDNQ